MMIRFPLSWHRFHQKYSHLLSLHFFLSIPFIVSCFFPHTTQRGNWCSWLQCAFLITRRMPPPRRRTHDAIPQRSHMARLSRKRPHLIISGYEKEWGHYYKKSVSGLGPCRVGKVWGLYSFKMGLVAKVTSRQLLSPRICDNSSCLSGNIFFLSAKWLEPYLGIIKWVIGQSLGEPIIVNRPIIIVAGKESLVKVRTPLVLLESSLISPTARCLTWRRLESPTKPCPKRNHSIGVYYTIHVRL